MTAKSDKPARTAAGDAVADALEALLPVHTAVTFEALADATATAAERLLHAPYAFLYCEADDGRLERRVPASDVRRRSQHRAIGAFGAHVIAAAIDPSEAPAIAAALDGESPVATAAGQLFQGLTSTERANAAQQELGITSTAIVPLVSAGERVGALILLLAREPRIEPTRLFAAHVARAVAGLRQALAEVDQPVSGIAHSVFDARKLESDLQKELARADRYKHQVSIAVIEATNLRLLYEQFGRTLTDALLGRLGAALARDARDVDLIGTYKDSGYTMILTEATAEGAATAATRLLRTAQDVARDERAPGLELHLACGWATYPIDGKATDTLFAAAVRRMYEAAA
ncbi:MAG: diguanylate cyclase [Dehalococcoidia bacterium]|nr:MAG: diguanylate cyclase [Dehalococcoidia bacterium]